MILNSPKVVASFRSRHKETVRPWISWNSDMIRQVDCKEADPKGSVSCIL